MFKRRARVTAQVRSCPTATFHGSIGPGAMTLADTCTLEAGR